MSTIRSKIPTIEAFNCPEKSRQDLEAELKSLMHSKGEKFYNFCGFFSVILVIILSFRNEFFGLDLDLFFALLANLVLIFSFTFTYITSKFLGNMLTKFFLPSMQLEKERANLERENLEKEIEKRTAFEEALANWQYYNLVTEEGFWLAQKGQNLELAIKDLVSKKGWNTMLTSITGDAGIDLICEKNEIQVLVQAKGHSKPLGVAAIRDAAGVKMAEKPDQMIVVCPKGFTKGSVDFAAKTGIKLINAASLVKIANGQIDLSY